MRFQVEISEPFLDQSLVAFATALDRSALLGHTVDALAGKAPLRTLYDLYPSQLPTFIRDRRKALFHEGAGASVERSVWLDLFEAAVSNAVFRDGQRQFADFNISTKEKLFCLRTLAARMDVKRVPHLRCRLRLDMPRAA